MTPAMVKFISGLVGVALMALFILGLAHSISTGFAGFLGRAALSCALPFRTCADVLRFLG